LVPARPVADRKALHLALSRVHSGGSTNLHGGWQVGADALLPDAGQAALARVILLSDGNANVGKISPTPPRSLRSAHRQPSAASPPRTMASAASSTRN